MRKLLSLVLLLVALPLGHPRAGLDPSDPAAANSEFQLVVLEAEGCTYCGLFRRDLLPAFEASEHGKTMPVRFIDVNDIATAKVELKSDVDIVPTFVVTRENKEIGRIPGYVGQADFFHSINYLISNAP